MFPGFSGAIRRFDNAMPILSPSLVKEEPVEETVSSNPAICTASMKRQAQFLNSMNAMRKNQQLCDVELMVEGKTVPAHRLVLSACSAFFHAMFTSKYVEAQTAKVELKEVELATMNILVDFAYTGDVALTSDNVQSIMSAANRYQIIDVKEQCSKFLVKELSPDNTLGIRDFANFLNCAELLQEATNYSYEHFTEVCKCEEFLELSLDQVTEYLSKDDLVVRCEDEVFDAAVRWIKHKKDERMPLRTLIFEKIRFPLITKSYLSTVVEEEETMQDDTKCLKMLVNGMKHHLLDKDKLEKISTQDIRPRAKKHDWQVAVFGGSEQDLCQLFSVDTPLTNPGCSATRCHWKVINSMPEKRRDYAVACINNIIYIVGGSYLFPLNRVDCYNITTQSYSSLSQKLEVPRDCLAAAACKGKLYITGGTTNHGSSAQKCTDVYEPLKDRWFSKQPMFYARYDHAMVECNGWLYVCGGGAGGGSNGRPLKSCEKFYSGPNILMNNRWAEIAPMNCARRGLGLAVAKGLMYAIGGYDENGTHDTVECYDPRQNQWKMVAKLPWKLRNVKCAVLNDVIYILAAQRDMGRLTQVLEYQPSEDRWVCQYNARAFGLSNIGVTVVDVCAAE
ncbi:kelch-like protein 7 [Glandiceps talaboti]